MIKKIAAAFRRLFTKKKPIEFADNVPGYKTWFNYETGEYESKEIWF